MCYGIPLTFAEYALFASLETATYYLGYTIYNGLIYITRGCPPIYNDLDDLDNLDNLNNTIKTNTIIDMGNINDIRSNMILDSQPPPYGQINSYITSNYLLNYSGTKNNDVKKQEENSDNSSVNSRNMVAAIDSKKTSPDLNDLELDYEIVNTKDYF